ncbi:MAG: ABC transporter permease [Nitriliruptoraceae bacterium]
MQALGEFLGRRWPQLLELAVEHLLLVLTAIVFATLIGVTIGVLVYRSAGLSSLATAVTATILTVPSLALFGLMIVWVGLGDRSATIALTAYALLPIVRNTVTGLQGVDPAVNESARGMGLGARARLLRIDLPLAWPVILTGVRVATMLIVSIAAIAAYIGAGGLGNWIFDGLARRGSVVAMPLIISGTLGVVAVAFLLDAFYILVGRLTTPRGIRD